MGLFTFFLMSTEERFLFALIRWSVILSLQRIGQIFLEDKLGQSNSQGLYFSNDIEMNSQEMQQ